MNRQVAANLDKIITALQTGSQDGRRRPPVRPDPPLPHGRARRHELTRAKAIQALRELDRTGTPVTFAAVATAAGISRSWLYTQPDIRDQIQQAARHPRLAPPAAGSPPASGQPTRRCAPGSPPPSTATSRSPTTTPGSTASSPAHSATSGQPGPDPVTIQPPETTLTTPPPSRQRHCPRRDGAGHSPD